MCSPQLVAFPPSPSEVLEAARPFVRAVARSFLSGAEDVEDAVQETILRAYLYREQLKSPAAHRAWLREITRSVCLNLRRRERSRFCLVTLDIEEEEWRPAAARGADAVTEPVVSADSAREIRRLVSALPALYGEPLALLLCEGLSYQAIAERLGLPLGTVKVRLHRGRKLLLSGSSGRSLRSLFEGVAA
jgi:RNA polymerase sigma-70 factor, ECF subfamily